MLLAVKPSKPVSASRQTQEHFGGIGKHGGQNTTSDIRQLPSLPDYSETAE